MGVGLKPLEFTDCLTDSPYFRENLHYHERELEKTSQQIKRLIKEVKDLLSAAKSTCRPSSLSPTLPPSTAVVKIQTRLDLRHHHLYHHLRPCY
jgi:hypothetical protein